MNSHHASNGHDEHGNVSYTAPADDFVRIESGSGATIRGTGTTPAKPTDVEYVANSIDHLRHLDLKAIVEQMFGETMPANTAEAMDKIATWALANKTKVGP